MAASATGQTPEPGLFAFPLIALRRRLHFFTFFNFVEAFNFLARLFFYTARSFFPFPAIFLAAIMRAVMRFPFIMLNLPINSNVNLLFSRSFFYERSATVAKQRGVAIDYGFRARHLK